MKQHNLCVHCLKPIEPGTGGFLTKHGHKQIENMSNKFISKIKFLFSDYEWLYTVYDFKES